MKKLLLSLGALASVAAPIAMTISCGGDGNTSLDDIKTNAINKINANSDLTQEQKNELIKMINEAKTEAEISEIVEGAGQSALNTSLENAKTDSINKINLNDDLTQEQKDGFVQKIKEAKTEVEVSEIVKEAEQAALDAYKKTKVAYVNALDNETEGLTDEDKVSTVAAINDADTKEEVDEAVANLRSSALEKYKVANLKLITRSDKLNDADKTAWTDKLNDAKDLVSARKIVDEMNNKIFEKAKADALIELNSYKTLSADKKAICENAINNSKNNDELSAAIKNMQSLAFGETKNNAKLEVDGYSKWTDDEKAKLKSEIGSANDVDELNTVVAAAKLAHEKANATSQINLLDSIDSEKASFLQDIKDATTISQVQDIIDAALLQQTKNKAKAVVDGYKLTDSEKAKFKSEIDKATDANSISAVAASALASHKEALALQQAKDKANAAIDKYALLAPEKQSFKDRIDKVANLSEIQPVVDAALLQQEKEKAIKAFDTFKNMDAATMDNYKLKINSASTIEAVDLIAKEAKIIEENLGTHNFNITLNDGTTSTTTEIAGLSHTTNLSNDDKLEVVKNLLSNQKIKVEQDYDPKYGDDLPTSIFKIHGKVIPGIHHGLKSLTDEEKIIYFDNAFVRLFINRDDDSPDFEVITSWDNKRIDESVVNMSPELNKGGSWPTDARRQYCLHPDVDGLITLETYHASPIAKLLSTGATPDDLTDTFKIQFFNNIWYPTYTGYMKATDTGSFAQIVTAATEFTSRPSIPNELVIDGEHFKVSHVASKLDSSEGAKIYDKLVKSLSSLALVKIAEAKKVSSYELTTSEKLKLMDDISKATTVKQINDLVNVVKSK